MTDEILDEVDPKELEEEFEKRIKDKLDSLGVDYDLSDMKVNDLMILRLLAQSIITLEDLEMEAYRIRSKGVGLNNLTLLNKLGEQVSILRRDISSMQNDLNITRKIRKGDKEESVINYIENLKVKAKEFYHAKMMKILCPNCGELLATTWFLYPESKNELRLVCKRKLPSGDLCNTQVRVTSQELLQNRGVNKPELMPESLV